MRRSAHSFHSWMCRSVPQIDAPCTRTSTSSSCGTGMAVSTSSAPGPRATLRSARIVPPTCAGYPAPGTGMRPRGVSPRPTAEDGPMHFRSIVPLILLALVTGACAETGPGGDADPPGGGISHETEPSALLLRWGSEGGFTPSEYQLTNLPSFSLYGDGTIVRPGPQIAIYPGPALPALETVRVDEAGIQAILQAAFDVDLDTVGDLADMGSVGVADAPETVFTLRAGGVDRTVRVYALSELGGRPPG